MPIKPTDSSNILKAQEYVAIHLKVPNSGTEWLDRMILQARKMDADAFRALVSKPATYEESRKAYEEAQRRIKENTRRRVEESAQQPGKKPTDSAESSGVKPQGPPNPPKGGKGRKIA